jgi:hypothetical protein
MLSKTALTCLVVTALGLAACAPQEQQAPGEVVNQALGIRLAPLPPGFVVSTNQGPVLELSLAGQDDGGVISFEVGPEDSSPNLIAAMSANQRRIQSLPKGDYKGGQELQGPLGTAFYSRGLYDDGSGLVEETRIFTVHPNESKILTLVYRYPAAADSSVRVTQLLEIFALVDGIQPAAN